MKILTNKVDWNIIPDSLTMLFFGPPKTHKTTEACNWSSKGVTGTLLIDTELGGDFVDGANRIVCTSLNPPMRPVMKEGKQMLNAKGLPAFEMIPPEERGYVFTTGENKGKPMPVYSLAEVISGVTTMINDKEFPYETIIFDTIDQINDWVEADVCEELKIPAMGGADFGVDWAMSRNKTSRIFESLKMTLKKNAINLILISHSKTASIVNKKVQLGPDLPKGLSKKLMGMLELIGYTSIDEKTKKAMITFDGFDEIQMGSRLRPLAGQTILFNYETFTKTIQSYTV